MIDKTILRYYELGLERDRLADPRRTLEYLRTLTILERHLPPAPARVLDLGAGPGRYSLALAERGHRVTLIDPVPLHLDQAREAAREARLELTHIGPGDARDLTRWPTASFDAILLLGPLYHLPDAAERRRVWEGVARLLAPGGVAVAAGVSRHYTAWEMLSKNKLDLPGAEELLEEHWSTGLHQNPAGEPAQWTTAYLHTPRELAAEPAAAGLGVEALLMVEGPAKLLPDLAERMTRPRERDRLLHILATLEAEPSVLGTSEHLLVIARASRPQ